MEDQHVRAAIRLLITRKEARISELRSEIKGVSLTKNPVRHRVYIEDMRVLDHSIMTLIELEHNLQLCDCPTEAFS